MATRRGQEDVGMYFQLLRKCAHRTACSNVSLLTSMGRVAQYLGLAFYSHFIYLCMYIYICIFCQSTMPVAITPRWAHTAVAFGSGPSFRVVVLFGGSDGTRWLSETTLLLLGEHYLPAPVFV